jgi:hypothetical protein
MMIEWIDINDTPIDFDKVAFILTKEGKVKPFRNAVSIFEHGEALYDILTATHWMPAPEAPK